MNLKERTNSIFGENFRPFKEERGAYRVQIQGNGVSYVSPESITKSLIDRKLMEDPDFITYI